MQGNPRTFDVPWCRDTVPGKRLWTEPRMRIWVAAVLLSIGVIFIAPVSA